MRIRRSVAKTVGAFIVPAICTATVAYFGYFTIWGSRGLLALASAREQLDTQRAALASIQDQRLRLQHRTELLANGNRDLIEELRRDQSLSALPGEVSVRRSDR